jgi:hypothetical protein
MVTPSCDRMKPSRDVCTPRALPDQWMTRYFPTSTNAPERPRIPAFRNSREFRAGIEHGHGLV